ncbi:splicing factor, Prp19-binding domain-containing protein [Boeremia exigua]|uniref:splicing factor, Prp19-binding domain-containing protein n=1 Tax=Boeremia exigua TaxID=749465 RepID=UPI001E8EECFF|nr:splicing factor, Prp19-binding domain-containing protein [Boeremia exigua]KAH6625326.1 splicing factor, Prp19-binding domain-containing protein [Boeremia exigua]
MPPPKSKKLTAQPVRTRQFAGKPGAVVEEPSSSEESESEEEQRKPKPFAKPKPAPIASSFPKSALKPRKPAALQKPDVNEDDFETESEDEDDAAPDAASEESSSEEESSEEDESSEDEAPRKLLRPVFIKKNARATAPAHTPDQLAAADAARREEATRALVQQQVEARLAERAAAKRDWDDDIEETDLNAIDDTDRTDPAAEYLAWKLRELTRIKRARAAIEAAEAALAELERRRNLSAADRAAEDAAHIAAQEGERENRPKAQFMQKYYHKGAFFAEELAELGLDKRDLVGARFEDQTDRSALPEYMQIRDLTKLGKKGGTRYRDMRAEDTGRWGEFGDERRGGGRGREEWGLDERFRGDGGRDRNAEGPSGANAGPLGERKRGGEEREGGGKRPRV